MSLSSFWRVLASLLVGFCSTACRFSASTWDLFQISGISPNFGLASQYETGRRPRIALSNSLVVEVHESELAHELYYKVGSLNKTGGLTWSGSNRYNAGSNPDLALNKAGHFVEVHEGQARNLFYQVGNTDGNQLRWSGAQSYDLGKLPRISLNNHGGILAVHQISDHTIGYRFGHLESKTILWSDTTVLDSGVSADVALNDKGLVVVAYEASGELYYRAGVLANGKITLGQRSPYAKGQAPSVSLADDDLVVEVHQLNGNLVSRTGKVENQSISWFANEHFDTGAGPSVASDGNQSIQVHESEIANEVWFSNCLLLDRKRWMELSPGLAKKQLWQISLPGTHDSGAYNLSTDRAACAVAPAWIPGSMIRPFAEAQTHNIAQQLEGGIRFLDLRAVFHKNDFYAYHDCIGDKISKQLDQVASFLSSTNSELVVLKASHFCTFGNSEHAALINMIQTKLGPYLFTEAKKNLATTPLEKITQGRSRVLVDYDDDFLKENPVPGLFRKIPIYDQFSNSSDLAYMRNDQRSKGRSNPGTDKQMFLLSWTLTFTGLSDMAHGSLYKISRPANAALGGFINEVGNDLADYRANVLYVDFYRDSRNVDFAVWLNQKNE